MFLYKSTKKILILKNSRLSGLMDSKDLCRALAALLQFRDGRRTSVHTGRCALVPLLRVKSKHPHHGTQIVSQIPKDGEDNRGQMPHICSSPPLPGLNIDRCITQHTLLANYSEIFTLLNGSKAASIFYGDRHWITYVTAS